MKNILKKVIVLAIVATMFVMPASSTMAAANPIVSADPEFKSVTVSFSPDHLYLTTGVAYDFPDPFSSSREWVVPAGKNFIFHFLTDEARSVIRVQIYKNGSLIKDQAQVSTMNSHQFNFPAESTTNSYLFVITALSDFHVDRYGAFRLEY